ncbi:hypothetical protein [Lentzea flaviverrucosa]|uniref:Uncharacterized protein n=1 Tax=Lentzea flaviverrucosa TaxID=200379 RepID=A0A1H9WSX1_9PSEU|nr:hypothetical protein [Lentzea flaviverrucosa]RDI23066.1 hypothetical protein DFR72_111197 [Lentzea flaviverrucosa]SES36901.1 hypothetical protein SAMN05216195_112192 [Lentzea flaviverrucosa]
MSTAVVQTTNARTACRRAQFVSPPLAFRFADTNPRIGRSLAQSRFHELPQHVASVVADRLRLTPQVWDALAEDDEVHGFVGAKAVFEVWQTREGWRSRQFTRPGTEVLDSEDDGV